MDPSTPYRPSGTDDENEDIARMLERTGELLRLHDANPFRVRSYEQAAGTLRALERPLSAIYRDGGEAALLELDHVGRGLASSLREILESGRFSLLERLESEAGPGALLTQVPGIGTGLAHRIHDELGVNTLEELEQAAHDGRLARVEGIGRKKLHGVQDALAGMLSRSARRRAGQRRIGDRPHEPPVATLLAVDALYRDRAEAGELRRIAPRRFNPEGERWLPVMDTERDGWSFTAMYSNTARAHELGRTHDWVVLYFKRDHTEQQCTVVTARGGPLAGRRVVRGRERECAAHYGGV